MDWGQKFEKLAQIYRPETEAEGSEDESPNTPSKPSRSPPFLPLESTSEMCRNGIRPSPPSPAPSSPSSSVVAGNRLSYITKSHNKRPQTPVLVTKSTTSGSPMYISESKLNGSAQVNTSLHSSSHKLNHQKIDTQLVSNNHKLKVPPSSLPCKQQMNIQTLTTSKRKPDPAVTTINNLYTNPSQRSTVTTKGANTSCDNPKKASKEPVVNGHVIIKTGPRQCVEKSAPRSSAASSKNCDSRKGATTAKSVKGVETWC